jgi:diguanylate cyclase (GGDEF)-like protein
MLDFDGLREANKAFGYVEGGNALIRVVADGLADLARPDEFLARMNTAGDEFVLLLPGQNASQASVRCREIETALDRLPVPTKFAPIYLGASVGSASRRPAEKPGQTLGRAAAAMRHRKTERNSARGIAS